MEKKEHLSLDPHEAPSSSDNIQQHVGKDSFEIFLLFLSPEIIDYIVQQMNLYAKQDKNEQNFSIDTKKMSHFINLLLIIGYHRLPRENDYWSTSTSRKTLIFTRTMS